MNTTTTPPTDWQAIETEFVNGFKTYEDLAKTHGINPATLRKRGERGAWTEKRHTLAQSVTAQAQEKLTLTRVDELAQFNNDTLEAAKAIRLNAANRLDNDELTPNELRSLAGALEAAQRIGRLALGSTTTNSEITANIPALEAKDLTDAQLLAIIQAG